MLHQRLRHPHSVKNSLPHGCSPLDPPLRSKRNQKFYGQLQICTPSAPPIVILTPALALLPNTRELKINHKCHVWIHAPKKSKTKLSTKPSHRVLLRITELPKPKLTKKKTSPSHPSQNQILYQNQRIQICITFSSKTCELHKQNPNSASQCMSFKPQTSNL